MYCMPDEARDGRNVALKFLSDCWHARLSKAEFLHQIWCALCNMTLLHTDWSKERLIEAWFSDMVEACEKAGIPIPDMNSETQTLH